MPRPDWLVVDEPLEVLGQGGGCRVAVVRLARDRHLDDRGQVARHGRVELSQPRRLIWPPRMRSNPASTLIRRPVQTPASKPRARFSTEATIWARIRIPRSDLIWCVTAGTEPGNSVYVRFSRMGAASIRRALFLAHRHDSCGVGLLQKRLLGNIRARIFMKPRVSPISTARPTRVIGRLPTWVGACTPTCPSRSDPIPTLYGLT